MAFGLEMADAAMNLDTMGAAEAARTRANATLALSLIHISEPTRPY